MCFAVSQKMLQCYEFCMAAIVKNTPRTHSKQENLKGMFFVRDAEGIETSSIKGHS